MVRGYPRWLYVILVVYFLAASLTSLFTPPFESYDEVWHYPLVEHLANNGLRLPEQDHNAPGLWKQEGSQPPLYYLMMAIMTSWVDTSNFEAIHRLNPLPQTGIVVPDGNVNTVVHNAAAEAFPWQGTMLAVQIIRVFSIVLGGAAVLVTYHLALEVFPERQDIALGAAALHGFLPQFVLISASVSNDALSNLLGSVLLLLVVRLIKRDTLAPNRDYIILGVVTGMGLLSKLSVGFMIPMIALALAFLSWRTRNWRPLIIGAALSGGVTILIAGWWYWRNWTLYDDPTGLNEFFAIVGERVPHADLAQVWSERYSILKTYWGAYGGINILLPEWLYTLLNVIGGIALLGWLGFLMNRFWRRAWDGEQILVQSILTLWPVITFIGLLRWTAETPASQGRLLFVALSALSIWMAVGLSWWLPKKWRGVPVIGFAGLLALTAVLAPVLVVRPAFARPAQVDNIGAEVATYSEQNGPGRITLHGAEVQTETVRPGGTIELSLIWRIAQPVSQNLTLYVHLITPEGVIVGQRDVYPGRGLLATSDLEAGRAWGNPLAVPVPRTAYTPSLLNVVVGWYNVVTGERLLLPDGEASYGVGQVNLTPLPSADGIPNPLQVNFGDRIELLGYDLSTLAPQAGETLELTLYWRGLAEMDTDYVVFANVIDKDTLAKFAASNNMPAQWTRPTTTWEPGEIIEDVHLLAISPDAPSDTFEIEIGLYVQDEAQTFPRLFTVPEVGSVAQNYLFLSPVRIQPAEEATS